MWTSWTKKTNSIAATFPFAWTKYGILSQENTTQIHVLRFNIPICLDNVWHFFQRECGFRASKYGKLIRLNSHWTSYSWVRKHQWNRSPYTPQHTKHPKTIPEQIFYYMNSAEYVPWILTPLGSFTVLSASISKQQSHMRHNFRIRSST